jgi:hypothetical protein
MGLFWASLLMMIGPLVYKVVVSLGVGWVTFSGMNFLVDQLLTLAQSEMSNLDPVMFQIVGLLRLDDAIALLTSAMSIKFTLMGMGAGGRITKQVWNAPGPFQA